MIPDHEPARVAAARPAAGSPASTSPRALLESGVAALGLDLPEGSSARLAAYVALLERWNQAYNLTGTRTPGDIVRRHVLDSLAAARAVVGPRLLDVGSGAGLPGLVLAVARPEIECTLLDVNAKKIRFLRHAVAELDIANAVVVRERIEEFRPGTPFSTIITRAVMSIAELIAVTERALSANGRWVAMKGRFPESELVRLGEWRARCRVERIRVPFLDEERHLAVVSGPAT